MKDKIAAHERNLDDLALDEDVRIELRGFVARNYGRMEALASKAYEGENPDFPICRLMPLSRLAVLVWKLTEIRQNYLKMAVSEEIYRDTIGDIALRQRLYYTKTGKIGLSKGDCNWLRHLSYGDIFKLGVLQFQPFEVIYLDEIWGKKPGFRYREELKSRLPAGSPVVNVHIQKGTDLKVGKVKESFALAKDFFKKVFPDKAFEAFVCYSWLLYPGLREVLPARSRILAFADFFEILGVSKNREQAVERIFGKRFRAKADHPQNTSLQRAALARMDCLGYAIGLIWW